MEVGIETNAVDTFEPLVILQESSSDASSVARIRSRVGVFNSSGELRRHLLAAGGMHHWYLADEGRGAGGSVGVGTG